MRFSLPDQSDHAGLAALSFNWGRQPKHGPNENPEETSGEIARKTFEKSW